VETAEESGEGVLPQCDDGASVAEQGVHDLDLACAASSALAPKDVHLADTDAKAVVMAKASSQIAEE
jgi:hypothetical protein